MVDRMRGRRRWRPDRGVAAAEFAIVLPVLLLLVFGCIDFGWYFYVDQIVTNAAREGARAGSVVTPGKDADALAAAKDAADWYLTKAGFAPKGVSAVIGSVGGVDTVEVTIAFPVGTGGALTGFLAAVLPDNARAKAVMRWQ